MPPERLVRTDDLDAVAWFLIDGEIPAVRSVPEVPGAAIGVGFPLLWSTRVHEFYNKVKVEETGTYSLVVTAV